MKYLNETNNHIFICGITRSGKTYFTKYATAKLKRPVLFFNIQDEELPPPFLEYDPTKSISQLQKLLRSGYKINFRFGDLSQKQIMRIIAFILDALMLSGDYSQAKPIYIVLDEAQILKGEALRAAIDVSTRGLSRGLRLISITQRPALVNKTIYTQAVEQYIFRLAPSEAQYLKAKGIDFDYCLKEWERLGKYSYIYSDGFTLKGQRGIT